MKKVALAISLLLFVQGCTYAISREYTRQADKTISLQYITQDPEAYKGKLVVLGGTIVATRNTDHGTVLEIQEHPLDYWGRPVRTDETGGLFLLRYPANLNALLYAPGREITTAAEVAGADSARSLEDGDAAYPLLLSKELKLWKDERKAWTSPQWFDPLNDPNGSVRTQW